MINVYLPRSLYRVLSHFNDFNPTKDNNSFIIYSANGDMKIHQVSSYFFEELNKSKPLLDALVKEAKQIERDELQKQIKLVADKHRILLEQLKELEGNGEI